MPTGEEVTVPDTRCVPLVLGTGWAEAKELLELVTALIAADPPDRDAWEGQKASLDSALARLDELVEHAGSVTDSQVLTVRAPLRWSTRYTFAEGAGLASLTLDLRLTFSGYAIERLEARGPGQAPLDLEALRRFGFKEALRQSLFDMLGKQPETAETLLKVFSDRDTKSLERVAVVYGLAQLLGDAPTTAVARSLNITPAAAAQRVRRARAGGFLPPVRTASKGKGNAKKEHTDLRPPERAETDPVPRTGRDTVQGVVRNSRRG